MSTRRLRSSVRARLCDSKQLSKPIPKQVPEKIQKQEGELTPLKAFGFGAVLNFIGIPFALSYFAAVDRILKADFTTAESLIVLVSYNVLYALPFMIVPALVAISGDSSKAFLQRVNDILERGSNILMPVLLLLIGGTLIADAVSYFATGQGLF